MKELARPVTRRELIHALREDNPSTPVADAVNFLPGQTNLFKLNYMRQRAEEMRDLVPGVVVGEMEYDEQHFGVDYPVIAKRAVYEGVTLAETRLYPHHNKSIGYRPVEGVMLGGLSKSGETVIVDVTRYKNPEYGEQGKPIDVYRIKNGRPTAKEGLAVVEMSISDVLNIGHQPPTETILVGHTGFSHDREGELAHNFGIFDIPTT